MVLKKRWTPVQGSAGPRLRPQGASPRRSHSRFTLASRVGIDGNVGDRGNRGISPIWWHLLEDNATEVLDLDMQQPTENWSGDRGDQSPGTRARAGGRWRAGPDTCALVPVGEDAG